MSPKSTHELMNEIQTKDRRFRQAQVGFMALVMLLLIAVGYVQLRTLAAVQEQLTQQEATIAAIKQDTAAQEQLVQEVNRHLDCIVIFFTHKDRTTLSIKDINKCTLQKGGDTQTFFDRPSRGNSQANGQSSQSQQSSTPSSTGSTTSNPSNNSGGSNPPTETPTEPKDPVKVDLPGPLPDVPLCVPLSEVCVR